MARARRRRLATATLVLFFSLVASVAPSVSVAASSASSLASDGETTNAPARANDTAALLASSDLTSLFYRHFNNGVIVAPLALSAVLPADVAARLAPYNLSFGELDGFLQRALLWDAGYIYSPSSNGSLPSTRSPFLKVYTRQGVSMAAIAPTRTQMESAGCALQICTTENFGSTWRAVSCQNQNAVLGAVQCAIDASGGGSVAASAADGRQRSVWTAFNTEERSATTDQQLNKTELASPDVNVAQYEYSNDANRDADAGATATPAVRLLAIHTVPFSDEPPVGQCPSSRTDSRGDLLPTLTIPCAPYDVVSAASGSSSSGRRLASAEWARPQESQVLVSWLETVAPKSVVTSPTPVNGARPSQPSGQNQNGNSNSGASSQLPGGSPNTARQTSGSSGGFNLINLVWIVIGAVVVVAVGVGFVLFRKRNNSKQQGMDYGPYAQSSLMKTEDAYVDAGAFLSPQPGLVMGSTASRNVPETEFHSSNDSTNPKSVRSQDPEITRGGSDRRRPKSALMTSLRRVISEPSSVTTAVSRPSLDTEHLKLLQTDPNLSASRVSYDKIVFEKIIAKSARYEVWLSQYEGEEIAVKRLARRPDSSDLDTELSLAGASAALQLDDSMANAVEAFVAEIQITAALEHPNLARFVGVAWARIPADSLCLVTEYQSNGDLRTYIQKHRDQLTWPRQKIKWAKGVANGLRYLHNQRPIVLHLELNSTHVLLSDRLQAKLIDFGERLSAEDWTQLRISGEKALSSHSSLMQEQQRSFPYWAAPEVLRGEGHLTASDVYSFGMLLVELDSCRIPFHDSKNTSNGKKLKPFQKMNMVISGRLIPTVSSKCPADIRLIIERCTDAVPGRRPKMPEVVRMLELANYEMVL